MAIIQGFISAVMKKLRVAAGRRKGQGKASWHEAEITVWFEDEETKSADYVKQGFILLLLLLASCF